MVRAHDLGVPELHRHVTFCLTEYAIIIGLPFPPKASDKLHLLARRSPQPRPQQAGGQDPHLR
eukprot:14862778-Alexandrium_andersonii.AAC.1